MVAEAARIGVDREWCDEPVMVSMPYEGSEPGKLFFVSCTGFLVQCLKRAAGRIRIVAHGCRQLNAAPLDPATLDAFFPAGLNVHSEFMND